MERHGLEKIKTTGDAYMVVSGVPTRGPTMPRRWPFCFGDARGRDRVARRTRPQRANPDRHRQRAGGGRRCWYAKVLLRCLGRCGNVAARMETTGSAGRIQVSQDMYECLRDEFVLAARGEIEVKGKGKMPTWFLYWPASRPLLFSPCQLKPAN